MKTEITNEDLLKFGFKDVRLENPIDPYEKVLSEPSDDPEEDEENERIALVITREMNVPQFGIRTPDGILFLNTNLEELAVIERCITGYSPNY